LGIAKADGRAKCTTLCKLIKNVLIISHRNADIERGSSIKENLVSQKRSTLSDASIKVYNQHMMVLNLLVMVPVIRHVLGMCGFG
jgi:hypothetical protein